jgi:DNA-binding CsgD family transcriptional regulator
MVSGGARAGRLLDRAEELSLLAAAIKAAAAGSGSAVLIEGAAGIGKTSLLNAACEEAALAGMTVLRASAAEFEGGYAWGVVRQLFDHKLQPTGALQLHDDAAELAAPALGHGLPSLGEDDYSVLHGLYWLTATLAQHSRVVVAVDDVHWADQPSARYLAHLVRRLDGIGVLVVLTVRQPRAGSDQDRALMASLASEQSVTLVRPAALTADACADMVRGALGGNPAPEFAQACHALTGGNPLLLGALLANLAAEKVAGTSEQIPHLHRLTPDAVSRIVLLQLGRMPPGALAAARAIAVLGTSATVTRAVCLSELDADTGAELIAMLMADGVVEGDQALRFVHPLVRSVVYQDLATPLRQRWHYRAARMLHDQGAPLEEVTVHLLTAGSAGDPWVVATLRRAAADARGRGAPDIARLCLDRALAEPPPAENRAEVLFELGTTETMHDPGLAVGHLSEALRCAQDLSHRAAVAHALSESLALCGRFAEAAQVLTTMLAGLADDRAEPAISLQAALLNTARWDLNTRPATRPLLAQLLARAADGELLDSRLEANLAIELTAAGQDREQAVGFARRAVKAMPQLLAANSTALPECVTVLLCADQSAEAWQSAQDWLQFAGRRGWHLSVAIAASVASLTALHTGDISEAIAYGQQAIGTANDAWIAPISAAFLIPALLERGEVGQAQEVLVARNLTGELSPTWPFVVVRHARGLLLAASRDHARAVGDLLKAGELAELWGIHNPAFMAWRSDAALSLHHLGKRADAVSLTTEEVQLARRWGGQRALGIALRVAGLVGSEDDRFDLLTEAVQTLRDSSAKLELARALIDLGAAHRRARARARARELLFEGLDLAHSLGGLALVDVARRELVLAGAKPRRSALRGRDALTPGELRVANLAAAGQTNRQIAQILFVTQRTVETHLTNSYAKLGISSRAALPAALADTVPPVRHSGGSAQTS